MFLGEILEQRIVYHFMLPFQGAYLTGTSLPKALP